MAMPISVAMATYNGRRFLAEQLQSLTAQTMPPAELVVSDDGSTDDTLAVLEAFAHTAPFRVRILPPHARFGFADNFLHAAEQCASPIVAFCDQDDVWLPHKLATAADRLATDGSVLALHRLMLTDETLRPIGEQHQQIGQDRSFDELELDLYPSGWGNTMTFRRELLTLIPRAERPRQPEGIKPLSHDHWVYTLAAALGRVSHIREPLILYRQHGANAFGTDITENPFRRAAAHLDTVRSVPLTTYCERAVFDAHMAGLLARLAKQTTDTWSAPAARAATRFAERAERRARRVRLYEGATLRARAATYAEFLRTPIRSTEERQARRRAMGKDLLLGVTGLGRRF